MTGEDTLVRVSKRDPCPICNKPGWCGVSADGTIAVCMRVSEGALKTTRNGGYLHVLRSDSDRRKRPRARTVVLTTGDTTMPDFARLAASYAAAVDLVELEGFAADLGVSVESLVRLRIGWAVKDRAWTFPMSDSTRRVRGLRLRSPTGRKWSVRGGREGLFLPNGLDGGGRLLVCEGVTDAAAALDLGFEGLGRSSCTGGQRLLAELCRVQRPDEIVIVADADEPGQRGAEALASTLVLYAPRVRVICPPREIKDLRRWRQAGAIHQDVLTVIDEAPVRRLQVGRGWRR